MRQFSVRRLNAVLGNREIDVGPADALELLDNDVMEPSCGGNRARPGVHVDPAWCDQHTVNEDSHLIIVVGGEGVRPSGEVYRAGKTRGEAVTVYGRVG